ncbi:hypothetical protein [Dactylosporangium darangshiense]|uniref:Lipoprotein n=1 Tax=Dactylosporangium darangshiense TaxID=579108 RepID=A0ABP8DVW0_9ACTN
MTRRSLLTVAVFAVLAAGMAACSSGGTASPKASASGTSTDVQKALDAGKRFAQCGRDHGLPNFPDPELYAGRIGYFHSPQDVKDQEDQVLKIPECRAILAEIPVLPDDRPPPSAADMQKLRDFAKCIREHGIPEWPDPKSDGTFPIAGTPIQAESKSSGRLSTAVEACKQYWDNGIDVSS